MSRLGVLLTALLAGLAVVLAPGVAGAHEPVFVTAADPTPASGPLLEDGNHSWAVYGVLTEPGATRGVRTQLTAGQALVVDLLIPDRSPERDLLPADLPAVTIRWPDGSTRTLTSDLRVPFDEPFSNTSYVRIAQLREPASQTGDYGLTVTGTAPARFTLATGTVEGFGGAKRDVEAAPAGGLAAWYATPPPTRAPVASTTTRPSPSRPSTTSGASASAPDDSSGSRSGTAIIAGVGSVAVVIAVATVVTRRRRRRPA